MHAQGAQAVHGARGGWQLVHAVHAAGVARANLLRATAARARTRVAWAGASARRTPGGPIASRAHGAPILWRGLWVGKVLFLGRLLCARRVGW